MIATQEKLRSTLKEAGSSATKSRLAVFAELSQSGPLNIARIAKQLEPTVDRATVYRTVDLFEKLGIVNRIWHGFKHHIELSEIFTPHHHHALCQNCGATVDIASSELEAALASLSKKHDFLAVSHSVEVNGLCSKCY